MKIEANLIVTDDEMRLTFGEDAGEIRIGAHEKKGGVPVYFLKNHLATENDFDRVATIFLPLHEDAEKFRADLALLVAQKEAPQPSDFLQRVETLLGKIGYPLLPHVKKPAKAQHRWNKAVSTIEFSADTRESRGTIVWQKRNEMLLKKGAVLMPTIPLNKDGSVGFSAKLGEKLRADYAESIDHFTTTQDLIFKSVNEVGIFLYFGGTNGWLEFTDADGKTIDSYTVV